MARIRINLRCLWRTNQCSITSGNRRKRFWKYSKPSLHLTTCEN